MQKKTLCYLRPSTKEQFAYFVKCIDPSQTIVHCSEHSSVDQTNLPYLYYSFLKKKKLSLKKTTLSKLEADDMIARCRLLRVITKKEALNHLIAMYLAINEVLNFEKPNFAIMQTVDSYVTDLIRSVCLKKKIKFIGIVSTGFNNCFRVTSRGEMTKNSKLDKNLTKLLLPKYIKESYTPDFITSSLNNPKKKIFIRWLKNFIGFFYFFIKRYLSGDRYNYHYWHQQIMCKQFFSLFPHKDIGNLKWENELNCKDKPSLYIPLQMFPEATVDYWCEDIKVIKYYETLEKLIKRLHNNFSLFVKEHPDVVGSRPKKFYSKIKNDRRITVIPTFVNSNYIVKKTDGVVIWTGSVGLDAMIRGKAVFSVGTPFFANGKRFLKIDLNTKLKKMLNHISLCKKNSISHYEQKKTFEYVAQQMYKGNYKNHFDWSEKNYNDIKDVKKMASSCRHLFRV